MLMSIRIPRRRAKEDCQKRDTMRLGNYSQEIEFRKNFDIVELGQRKYIG